MYKAYCVADDIMEPYVPFGGELVYRIVSRGTGYSELNSDVKALLLTIPTVDVKIGGKRSPLMVAAGQTTSSLFKCFNGELRTIVCPIK